MEIPGRVRLLAAVVAGLALVAGGTGMASAAQTPQSGRPLVRHGVIPMRGAHAVRPADAGDLEYHGGPVQQSPSVYLVFWGRQWTKDANNVQDYYTRFVQGLGESDDRWSPVTSQYDGQGVSPTFTGSVLKDVWVDSARNAPGRATADQIATEAKRAASHFGLSPDVNVQLVVVSPHNTHPDGFPDTGFCAWHAITDNGFPFTNQPYVLDAGEGCGAGSVQDPLDGFSIVGGHEFLEAVTDPDAGGGWFDAQGEENGDKCAWMNLHTIDLGTGSFAVQPTWSNAIHGCDG